jgi:hypothetical protein
MPRKSRVEYPGGIYHVLIRGDRREAIFREDGDRQRFVDTMERRRSGEEGKEFQSVRRGWCLGGPEFRGELLDYQAFGHGERELGLPLPQLPVMTGDDNYQLPGLTPSWKGSDRRTYKQ